MVKRWVSVRDFYAFQSFLFQSYDSHSERAEEEKPHFTILLLQGQFTRSWPISIESRLMWADIRFAPTSSKHSSVCLHIH